MLSQTCYWAVTEANAWAARPVRLTVLRKMVLHQGKAREKYGIKSAGRDWTDVDVFLKCVSLKGREEKLFMLFSLLINVNNA